MGGRRACVLTERSQRAVEGRGCWWVWMVVRFVCVVRVPLCARVSRVCPVCVPCVSRLPPVSFYRYRIVSYIVFEPVASLFYRYEI